MLLNASIEFFGFTLFSDKIYFFVISLFGKRLPVVPRWLGKHLKQK